MKRILSALLTAALLLSAITAFSVSASAEETPRIIPQAASAPVLDGKKDELYSKGFNWTLNVDNAAFLSAGEYDEQGKPVTKYEPASAEFSLVWYDGEADPTERVDYIDELEDKTGGLYLFASVKDNCRAWAAGNPGSSGSGFTFTPTAALWDCTITESEGTDEASITDSVYMLLDPADLKATEKKSVIGYAFAPYSSYSGNGSVCFPIPYWFEYLNWSDGTIFGDNSATPAGAGSHGVLEGLIGVTVRSTVDYEFSAEHPMPTRDETTKESRYIIKAMAAYQYAEIKGYTLEIFIPWKGTQVEVEDEINQFVRPYYGYEFGLGMLILDNYFDYPIGSQPTDYEKVHDYIKGNISLFDFCGDMEYVTDCEYSVNYNTYAIGDENGQIPSKTLKGDVNADGEIKLADAMMAFQYVAKVIELDDKQLEAADCNGDKEVKLADAMAIFKYVAKVTNTVEF